MIKQVLNKIFSSVANKEYDILNATYKKNKDDIEEVPVFNRFKYEDNNSNALVIYGDNTCGKSLISKVVTNRLLDVKVEVRNVSMAERTSPGIKRAFLFGDDSTQSTGETSFTFLNKAFKGMMQEEEDDLSVALFDEPDIGLSPKFSRALGTYFAQENDALNENKGIVIISHNTEFLKHFIKNSKSKISTLGINTDLSLDEWLNDDHESSIEELMGLTRLGRLKHSGISRKQMEIRKNK